MREYARTDHINQIQREDVIKCICNSFYEGSSQKVVNIFGESGVGKSYICRFIYYNNLVVPDERKVLIDLNIIANNNVPGIIQVITGKLGIGSFMATQIQMDKYFKSIDAGKADCLARCVDAFVEELNQYADCYGDVLLIFDTFETISYNTQEMGFRQILDTASTKIKFLLSGIERVNFSECAVHYHVQGFDEKEIKEYLISRNPKMKAVFKKHGTLLAAQIRKYTEGGNPILCGLVSDWLLHCKDLTTQVDYLLSLEESAHRHLVSWIGELDGEVRKTLQLTAFFNDRMTCDLLSTMSGMDSHVAKNCLEKMLGFSFVKTLSEEFDPELQIVLHDVVARLIREYFPLPELELYGLVESAIRVYDQMILEDRFNADDFRVGNSLRVEKMMCAVRNGKYDHALTLFENELLDGIDIFDYSFVAQLVNEVEKYLNGVCVDRNEESALEKWKYVLQIARAEVELSEYNVEKVIEIYKGLKNNHLYKKDLYKGFADGIFGRAVVNPCTIDCGKSLSDAIIILKNAIEKVSLAGMERLSVKLYYWLGNAYVRSGQNDKAQAAYDLALSMSQTNIQKVAVLLDVSKMLRLQQDVRKALEPLQKCDVLMETMEKNKGKYYYYKGNIYRDLDDMETAIIYYDMAFKELSNGDDNFTLCELNMDYAWLQYIRDDIEDIDITEVQKYLDEGWKLAEKYHFGTEYSEYYHILYEVQNYLEDYQNAYRNLDAAIEYAYQYSNIYMILDCLNHRAQRYYREGRFDAIPGVICEMEKVEKSGCKIRVFRGRAKLIQADIFFDHDDFDKALQEYFDGFVIVALYGNSRTNVELFDDLYHGKKAGMLSRKEKMHECLCHIPEPDKCCRKLRNVWRKKKISDDYKYVLDELKI